MTDTHNVTKFAECPRNSQIESRPSLPENSAINSPEPTSPAIPAASEYTGAPIEPWARRVHSLGGIHAVLQRLDDAEAELRFIARYLQKYLDIRDIGTAMMAQRNE